MMMSLVKKVQSVLPGYTVQAVQTPRGECIQAVRGGHVALLSSTCIRNAPGILTLIANSPGSSGTVREWKRGHLVIAIDHLHY